MTDLAMCSIEVLGGSQSLPSLWYLHCFVAPFADYIFSPISQSQKCVRAVSVLTQPRVVSESGILTGGRARTETNFKDQVRMTEITKRGE